MIGSIKLFDGPGGDKTMTTIEWTVVVKDGMIALAFPCQAGQRIRKKLEEMMKHMEAFVRKGGVTGGVDAVAVATPGATAGKGGAVGAAAGSRLGAAAAAAAAADVTTTTATTTT